MLKSAYPSSYQNLKCGEIFCISPPAVFNITCTICDQKIKFDDFIIHFQSQHLTLVEDTVNFNEFFIEKEEQVEDYRDYDDIGSNESEDDKYLEEIKSGPKKKCSKITRKSLARSVKKNKKVVDEFEISLDTDEKEFISIQENTLAENTISIDDEKLEKGVKENITVKEEDPRDDPIKQDFLGELKNIVGVDEEKDEQIEYDRDYDNVGNNLPQIKSQSKRKCSQNKIKGARKSLARNAKKTKKAKNDIDSDVVGEPEISLDTKGTKKDTKVNDNDDVVDEHEICLESNEKEFFSIQEIPLVNENEPVGGDVDSDEDEDYWPDETDLKETKTEVTIVILENIKTIKLKNLFSSLIPTINPKMSLLSNVHYARENI